MQKKLQSYGENGRKRSKACSYKRRSGISICLCTTKSYQVVSRPTSEEEREAEFLVVKGITNSRHSSVTLGVLHVNNQIKPTPLDKEAVLREFPEVFQG